MANGALAHHNQQHFMTHFFYISQHFPHTSLSVAHKIKQFVHTKIALPLSFRLYEVCQFLERDGQLLILLVFEHVEQDLSDLIDRLPKSGMSPPTIQVGLKMISKFQKMVYEIISYCSACQGNY